MPISRSTTLTTEGTATLGLYKYQGLHLVINERRQSTVLVGCPTTTIKLLFSQTCRVHSNIFPPSGLFETESHTRLVCSLAISWEHAEFIVLSIIVYAQNYWWTLNLSPSCWKQIEILHSDTNIWITRIFVSGLLNNNVRLITRFNGN